MLLGLRVVCVIGALSCLTSTLVIDHLVTDWGFMLETPPTEAFALALRSLVFSIPEYPHCTAITLKVGNPSDHPRGVYKSNTIPGFILVDAAHKEHDIRAAYGFPVRNGPLDPLPPHKSITLTLIFDELNRESARVVTLLSHSWALPSELTITTRWPGSLYTLSSDPLRLAGIASLNAFIVLACSWPRVRLRRFWIRVFGLIAIYSVLYNANSRMLLFVAALVSLGLLAVILKFGSHRLPSKYFQTFSDNIEAEAAAWSLMTIGGLSYLYWLTSITIGCVRLAGAARGVPSAAGALHLSKYLLLLLSIMMAVYVAPRKCAQELVNCIIWSLLLSIACIVVILAPAMASGAFWAHAGWRLGYGLFVLISVAGLLWYLGRK